MPQSTNEKIQLVLQKHLKGAFPENRLKEAAADLAKIDQGWTEVTNLEQVLGASMAVQCGDICKIGELFQSGTQLRVYMKKTKK